jgi:putative peptidoglycan lipid II flippase
MLTAFSPVLFNLTMIAVLIVLLIWRHDPLFSATVIAGTVRSPDAFRC